MKTIIWLHRIVGAITAITSLLFLVWFSGDFLYFFRNPSANIATIRTFGTIILIFFSWFYLSRGIAVNKINKFSTASLYVLCGTLLLSFILLNFECFRMGAPCPIYTRIIANINRALLLPGGITISFLLALIAITKARKETNPDLLQQ